MTMRSKTLGVALAGLATAVAVAATPGVAFGADQPTIGDLLNKCGTKKAKYCVFHADGNVHEKPGQWRDVKCVSNGTDSEQKYTVKWTESETTTDNVEVSVSVSSSFFKVFEASITATYGHTWEFSKSYEYSVEVAVKPHTSVVYQTRPKYSVAAGNFEMEVDKQQHTVHVEFTGPDQFQDGNIKPVSNCG